MNHESIAEYALVISIGVVFWAMLWRVMIRQAIIAKLRLTICKRRLELMEDLHAADRPHLLTLVRYENLSESLERIDCARLAIVSKHLESRPEILAQIKAEREEIKAAGVRFKSDLETQNNIVGFALMANSPFLSGILLMAMALALIFESARRKVEKAAEYEEAMARELLNQRQFA